MNFDRIMAQRLKELQNQIAALQKHEQAVHAVTGEDGTIVRRSVQDKLAGLISVMDFVPKQYHAGIRDGTTTYDAQSAIDDALYAARTTGAQGVAFDGKLFLSSGGHVIYDNLQMVGLGKGATMLRLNAGVPIDTSLFVTELYHAGMAGTTAPNTGTFGFGVIGMTLDGNKQNIPRVTTLLNGAITDSATTITVDSTTGFTAPGLARIANEIVRFTGTTSTTLTGCERAHFRSYAAAAADNTLVEYVPEWGAVGLGIFGAQYIVRDVRIQNFRNAGLISSYPRTLGGTHNYLNSHAPFYDVPDGDTHAFIDEIEVLNNQCRNMVFLGPHDSHVSHFTIVKDGDDLPGEPYWFSVAGLWVDGGPSSAAIDSAFGTQFSDGHVWGNHSYGIVQATGGVMWHNVQSEGAHVQFNNRSSNAMGDLRVFGASTSRSMVGAWLETGNDDLRIHVESHDYAGVVLGDILAGTGYSGGTVIADGYTNNPMNTTLSGGIDAVVTTIPVVSTEPDIAAAHLFHLIDNPDIALLGAANFVAFGVPYGALRAPVSFTIGNEEITYTSRDATNFYGCTRGANGTVAEAHTLGQAVYGVIELVRGRPATTLNPDRATIISRAHYNYEPVRNRQKESYLRRDTGLKFIEKRGAFGIGAAAALVDLDTKHKMQVSVTETEPANDYAVISAYGHMLRDTDAPTHTYHGIRSYLDTTYTDKVTKEAHGITGEINVRGAFIGTQITDAIGVFAGAYTSAAATGNVTRLTAVKTGLTHAGSGIVATGVGIDVTTPVGAGTYTNLIGLQIANFGKSGTTESYAIKIVGQSGSTTNYAIHSAGGQSLLKAGAAATVPLALQRHTGQTANLLELRNEAGAVLSYFDKDGILNGAVVGSVAWANVTSTPTTIAGYGITDALTTAGGTILGPLDISFGGAALVIGADSGLTTRTDATGKTARFAFAHYTNIEEPIALVFGSNTLTTNNVFIGGGSGTMNAATGVYFYTGATTTTTTGSRRMGIDSAGWVGIGLQAPVSKLDIHDTIGAVLTLRRQDTGVTANDTIGIIQFWAADTSSVTNFVVANIEAQATNTVTTDINPGRLIFRTTGTGVAATPTERLRIDESGHLTIADGSNIILNTTTGTQWGTASTQRQAWYGTTPVVQATGIIDADGTLADLTTKFNSLLGKMEAYGLLATA